MVACHKVHAISGSFSDDNTRTWCWPSLCLGSSLDFRCNLDWSWPSGSIRWRWLLTVVSRCWAWHPWVRVGPFAWSMFLWSWHLLTTLSSLVWSCCITAWLASKWWSFHSSCSCSYGACKLQSFLSWEYGWLDAAWAFGCCCAWTMCICWPLDFWCHLDRPVPLAWAT